MKKIKDQNPYQTLTNKVEKADTASISNNKSSVIKGDDLRAKRGNK